MSILIKGMKLPESCAECTIQDVTACGTDYKWLYDHQTYYDAVRPDCPLVELPPHGRLIDADELEKKIKMLNAHYSYREVVEYADIHNAPTIIEAEGQE